ncbi:Tll0287-like domain-containing protein [Pseudoteredinibacter isoporae]|uniref:Tll0287-like domain-containing protein n=1 Tax=Pseudoteredinibacter isoporae TaxID=570281 RepID=UPI003107F42C
MIRQISIGSLSLCLSLHIGAHSPAPIKLEFSEDQLQEELQFSQSVSKQLASSLKQTLMDAIKHGGLSGGIEQCRIVAPNISARLQKQHPSKLISAGRTSLKIRNPNNQATPWQEIQLRDFDQSSSLGHKPAYRYRFVNLNGRYALEYMSPIPTQGLCLNCHGEQLSPEVLDTLKTLYPNDQAQGYRAGDIRGAFIIRSWLDESMNEKNRH